MKKTLFCFAVAMSVAITSQAAITPIPIGGGYTNAFNTAAPTLADGWATMSWAGAAAGITNSTQMDAAAMTNNVADIGTAIGTDTTATNSTTTFGSTATTTSQIFRWVNGTADRFLGSRPTANAYDVLLVGFVNDSGSPHSSVVVRFNFGLDENIAGTFTDEDPRASNGNQTPAQLAGLRVYYSLQGTPGTWTHIPEFDLSGHTNLFWTNFAVNVTLSAPWAVNGNLYLLWADDNAVNGTTGTSGVSEGANAVDNFALDFGVCVQPSITTQPHPVTAQSCRNTNLTVVAQGSGATYQWFKDGSAITSGGTSATLNLTAPTAANEGNYWVQVTACGTTIESTHVHVSVVEDNPTVVRALLRCDRQTISVDFSEIMDTNANAGIYEPTAYSLNALDNGTTFDISSIAVTNGTNATLTLGGQLDAGKLYRLTINANVAACSGNPVTPSDYDLLYELCLIAFNDTWQVNSNGTDLVTDWRNDPGYDDTTGGANNWQTAQGAFDAKSGTSRASLDGVTINTHLALTSPNFNGGTGDIPNYYFRRHFTLPTAWNHILSLTLETLSDDFDVAWVNNSNTIFHQRPGMPAGHDVDSFTYSTNTIDTAIVERFPVDKFALNYGTNLMAAKIIQGSSGSSDITFGYNLVAIVDKFVAPIIISIAPDANPANVHITWTGGGTLYQANTIDALPAGWTSVGTGGSVIVPHSGAAKFYTIRQ